MAGFRTREPGPIANARRSQFCAAYDSRSRTCGSGERRLTDTLKSQHSIYWGTLKAFAALLVATGLVIALTALLQGVPLSTAFSPLAWSDQFDPDDARDLIATSAELLAAILAIAITVIAIVVELAANRYSHRITWLFVREPANIIVLSFFVLATIQSWWLNVTIDAASESSVDLSVGFALCFISLTLALIILLPYFAFVLSFLSPVSVVRKIRVGATKSLERIGASDAGLSKAKILNAIDELQDIARRATEISDRAIAMESVSAFYDLLSDYESVVDELPPNWFAIDSVISSDPDFVSLGDAALTEIENDKLWVEFKVIRQFLSLVSQAGLSSRDIVYLVAIKTKQIGIASIGRKRQLALLCIRCFNSYLRATVNNKDQRTSYYILNQYRLFAEQLLAHGEFDQVRTVARHFQFYGTLGFRQKLPFLLEVVAHDIQQLIRVATEADAPVVDDLLTLMLELDFDTRKEFAQESLLGIRVAQVQLATFFLHRNQPERAQTIADDLRSEDRDRISRIWTLLRSEDRAQFWEITDRGVNFAYLAPELREHLDEALALIEVG